MNTDLAVLYPTANELSHIRRHLMPQRRPHNSKQLHRSARHEKVLRFDEAELDLVELFARSELQLDPDAN